MLDEIFRLARDIVLLRKGVPTVDDGLVRLHVAVAPAGVGLQDGGAHEGGRTRVCDCSQAGGTALQAFVG